MNGQPLTECQQQDLPDDPGQRVLQRRSTAPAATRRTSSIKEGDGQSQASPACGPSSSRRTPDHVPSAAPQRVLVATAVPAERDAVARAFDGPGRSRRRGDPGPAALPRAGRSGVRPARRRASAPASAAASTAAALTAAALRGTPYDLVVSAGIGGGFLPDAPVGSLVVADEITAADLGAETADGFLPVDRARLRRPSPTVPPRRPGTEAAAATGAPRRHRPDRLDRDRHRRARRRAARPPPGRARRGHGGLRGGRGGRRARRARAGDPRGLQPGRPARPRRLADRRGARARSPWPSGSSRPSWRVGTRMTPCTTAGPAAGHAADRVLALPERHLRLRRPGPRPRPGRARARRDLRRHRHHQRHGRARRVRRAEGVVRRAAVGPRRVRAAALRRRAGPGLRPAGPHPGAGRRT